jgi:uncharacterized protein YgfB (UPF0149 family)
VDRPELPPHDAVTSELARLQLGADASELHGSLCGFLSAHGDLSRGDRLQRQGVETHPQHRPPHGLHAHR